jgi:hypothetical protein
MQKKQFIWKLLVVVAIIGLLSVAGAMAADEQTISGTIEQGDSGIVIMADDGMTYAVQGKDLSDMVGKSVKATGTLAESESGNTITVVKVEEIKKMME